MTKHLTRMRKNKSKGKRIQTRKRSVTKKNAKKHHKKYGKSKTYRKRGGFGFKMPKMPSLGKKKNSNVETEDEKAINMTKEEREKKAESLKNVISGVLRGDGTIPSAVSVFVRKTLGNESKGKYAGDLKGNITRFNYNYLQRRITDEKVANGMKLEDAKEEGENAVLRKIGEMLKYTAFRGKGLELIKNFPEKFPEKK